MGSAMRGSRKKLRKSQIKGRPIRAIQAHQIALGSIVSSINYYIVNLSIF